MLIRCCCCIHHTFNHDTRQPLQRAMAECREQAQRMAPVASATTMGESNWGLWPLCRQTTRRAPDARAFATMPLTPQRTLQNALCAATDFVAAQPGMWLLFMSHTPDHKRTISASSSSNFISTASTNGNCAHMHPNTRLHVAGQSGRSSNGECSCEQAGGSPEEMVCSGEAQASFSSVLGACAF